MFGLKNLQTLYKTFEDNSLERCTKKDFYIGKNPYNLPHYPVPELNATLTTYLKSLEPLLATQALEKSANIVRSFAEQDGVGQKLQQLLVAKANASDNWLYDWYLEKSYLGNRLPLVVHTNPGGFYDKRDFKSENDWLGYAAKLIFASLKFKELIDRNEMPVDKIGDKYLDMSSYENFFGSCRIPRWRVDYIQFHPDSKHIVVAYQNEVSA